MMRLPKNMKFEKDDMNAAATDRILTNKKVQSNQGDGF